MFPYIAVLTLITFTRTSVHESIGIGRSVAAAALAHRASVVISSSSHDRVAAAVEILRQTIQQQDKSGVSVRGQALDIKDFEALKAFLSQEGPFDHLVWS